MFMIIFIRKKCFFSSVLMVNFLITVCKANKIPISLGNFKQREKSTHFAAYEKGNSNISDNGNEAKSSIGMYDESASYLGSASSIINVDSQQTSDQLPEFSSNHFYRVVIDGAVVKKEENSEDIFNDIPEINKKLSRDKLIEGDIKPNLFRNAGGGIPWPKTTTGHFDGLVRIPYRISDTYAKYEKNIILEALETFSAYTCIRFTPKTNEKLGVFIKSDDGCWANIGAPVAGEHTVSLASSRCMNRGIALHEFMHTLGFMHEHARSDRDNFIKIVKENIKEGEEQNFEKRYDLQNLVVYDYNSVLHYRKTAFSKQPYLPTIAIRGIGKSEPRIGYRQSLSPYDIEEIKYYYNCEPGSYPRCGKDFINKKKGYFRSPSYPDSYSANSHCTWNITVDSGSYIEIAFLNVDIEDSVQCQNDAILIHDGTDAGAPLLSRICGEKTSQIFTSTSNNLFVIFTSDTDSYSYSGFKARFRKVSIPGIKTTLRTSISSTSPSITQFEDEFRCNFDNDLCNMTQDMNDKVNFRLNSGSTENENTGPTRDHTSGKGKYLFLDSSSTKSGDNAIVRTPWLRAGILSIKFSYHMYGELMGALRLFVFEKRKGVYFAKSTMIWEKYGNQNNAWHTIKQNYEPGPDVEYVQLYFEGYAYYKTSDMAIDDLQIDRKSSFSHPTVSSSLFRKVKIDLTVATSTVSPVTISQPTTTNRPTTRLSRYYTAGMPLCTFERKRSKPQASAFLPASIPGRYSNDLGAYNYPLSIENDRLCGWIQPNRFDNFNWSRRRGKTTSRYTGPTDDKTSGKGHYMYIEASHKHPGDVAFLQTYRMPASDYCIDLNYHMYGRGIGRLIVGTVQLLRNKTRRFPIIHQIVGDQHDQWQNVKIDFTSLPSAETVMFRLQGVVGQGSRGDIAVDDITIFPGKCDSCQEPSHEISTDGGAQFATGCVHAELFWVRCCSSNKQKFVYRRVRDCNKNMFDPVRLHWYCRNL